MYIEQHLLRDANVKEEWSEIISPKRHLFDLRLNEVWRYRDLLLMFVKRDFIAQYRQTILGPLWHIIQPVFTTVMFLIVFNKIAKISTDNLPPMLFYMSGITIWNFFAGCLNSTSSTFTANAGIFGKVYFPRLIQPLAAVTSNLIKFSVQFSLLLVLTIYYSATNQFVFDIQLHILLLPFILIIMAGIGLGVGIIISSLTTKYRDLNVLIGFGVSLLMYVTPVAYPLSYLQEPRYKSFIQWNPLSSLVEGFRYSFFGEGNLDIHFFTYSIIFMIVALISGVLLFNKVEGSFMDTV